jgi:hypothetical protein
MKTLRVCPDNVHHVKQESLACGIASQSRKPLGSRMMMSARLASLRELQSATDDDVRAAGVAAGVTVRYGGGVVRVVTVRAG